VLFDYLLIFGHWGFPEWGLSGAGVATTLSAYGAAVFGLSLIFSDAKAAEFQLRQNFKVHWELLGRFIRFGLPSGLQWALEGLAFTFFLAFIGRLPNGDPALAASSITVTIMMLALLPVIGVGQGVSALVGQYLGQDDPQQAVAVSWVGVFCSLVYIVCMGISFVLIPGFYASFFAGGGDSQIWPQVAAMVPVLLRFVAFFTLFDSLNLVLSFTLKGAGDTRFVSAVALLLPWPLMVVPTWYFSRWEHGVYWSWAAASLFITVQGLVFLGRFIQGRWKAMRVIGS
jgi:MATE family multidrug resistance protein